MSLIWFNGRIREEIYSGIKYDEFIEKLTSKLRDRESQRVNERIYESFIEDPWYISSLILPLNHIRLTFFEFTFL